MTDEDRLRNRLRDQASGVPIVSDVDDVAVRLGRASRKRTRPLVAAAVGIVVIGTLVAVVAERAGHDTPHVRVAGNGSLPEVVTTLPPNDVSGPTGPVSLGPPQPSPSPSGVLGRPATTLPPGYLPRPTTAPTLPAPGAEQPADPAAARVAITAAFETLGGEPTNEQRAAAIEDGPALIPAMVELRSGPYAAQVLSAKTVILGIVFLSPTRATVEFRSDLGTGGFSGPYTGDAVLNEHGWQIARDFYCRLIKQANVLCP